MNRLWRYLLDDDSGGKLSVLAMVAFGVVILFHQVWLKLYADRRYTHEPTGYTEFVEKEILRGGKGDLIQGEFLVGTVRRIDPDDEPLEINPGARETGDPLDPDLIDAGETNEGLAEAQDLVDLRLNEELLARASPLIQAFVEHSYLRGDLEFPSNFRYKFSANGNTLEVRKLRENVHRRYLPFSESLRYQGDILFRQDKPQIVLRDNTQTRYTLKSGEGVKIIDMAPQKRSDVAAQEIDLRVLGEQIATLRTVGETLVLRVVRSSGTACDVRLNGELLSPDSVRVLEPSDILYMEFPLPRGRKADYYLVVEEVREGVISTIRLTDQGRTRIPEEELVPGLSHLLEGALDTYVLGLAARDPKAARALQNVNLRLSLAEPLQRPLQERLVSFARKLDGIDGKAKEPFRKIGEFRAPPLRAAVTLLDATTGEILALASYPDEKTFDDLLAALDKKAIEVAQKKDGEFLQRAILLRRSEIERQRGTLLANQNFPLHQIGSIFKPIFALSLFTLHPDLATLEVSGHGENDNKPILGYDMGKFSDHAHGGWVNAARFIAVSCQRYMEYLGLFALGEKDPATGVWKGLQEGSGEIKIGGKSYRGTLAPACEAPGRCYLLTRDKSTEVRNLEKGPVFRELERRYGMELTRWNTDTLPETALYDTRIWRDVISTLLGLSTREEEPQDYFTGMSPARMVAYLEDFRALYRDYTQYLKGSGLNVWSNVTVAQAIARLVTGRNVTAWIGRFELPEEGGEKKRCPDGALPQGPFSLCPAEPLPPIQKEAWEAVLAGMEGVAEAGTARRLKSDVARAIKTLSTIYPGEKFRYFSKTGSVRRPWSMRLLLVDKKTNTRQSRVCPGRGTPACPSWLRNPEIDSLPGANYVFALVGGPEGALPTRGVVGMVYIADAGGSQVATQFIDESRILELITSYLGSASEEAQ